LPQQYYRISIPYGAIKSAKINGRNVDFRNISIPYGAIKSKIITAKI